MRTGDTSSGSQEIEPGEPGCEQLARLVVAIQRLSDALKRLLDIHR